MQKRIVFVGIGVAILAAIGGSIWYYQTAHVPAFPIDASDSIASWNFTGAYTGNQKLIDTANADLAHLSSLLGKGQYDDYDLYIGIGDENNLLGNGKAAYDNYSRAITVHPTKALAYANLGNLFSELGAYHTAAEAYAKATSVEPTQLEYYLERLNFLTTKLPTNSALVLSGFTDASNQFGDAAPILSIEARWLEGLGRYADAIKAWQKVKQLSPANRAAAIDAQIAADTRKL